MKTLNNRISQLESTFYNMLRKVNYKWQDIRNRKKLSKIFVFTPKNILVFFLMICSLVIVFNNYVDNNSKVVYRNNNNYTSNVGAIYEDTINFNLYRENVNENFDIISIRFSTYERKNNSDYLLTIYKNDNVIDKINFNTINFEDNMYIDFKLNNYINVEELGEYTASITPVKTDVYNNVTVMSNEDTGEIAVAYKCSRDNFNIITLIVLFLVIFYFFINKIINSHDISYKQFMIIAFGIVMVATLFTPPYQVPDERTHFLRTMQLSQYDFGKTPYENLSNKVITVPENIASLNYSLVQEVDAVSDINKIGDTLESKNNIQENYNVNLSGSAVSVAYIVPSIIIRIVDVFTNSPLIIFYSGRIACLILNFLLLYMAINITPKFKNTMLVIGMMPMSIQSLISYSYDGLLNACILAFIAICLKMIYEKEERIDKKYIILSIMLLFIVFAIKMPYAIIGILYIFIPSSKFKNMLWKFVYIVSALVIIYVFGNIISKISSIGYNSAMAADITTTNKSNVTYILNNPKALYGIAINTFKIKIQFYIDSIIGYFGYFSFKINTIFKYVYMGIFGSLILTEENNMRLRDRIVLLLGILLIAAGVFGALYFAWTPYAYSYVEGVQGRYFIPLLVPLVIVLAFKVKNIKLECTTVYSLITIISLNYLVLLLVNYF